MDKILGILLAFVFAISGLSLPVQAAAPEDNSTAKACTDFGLDLLRQLGASNQAENIFVSPLSIHTCLHMVLNGAKGQTYDEMSKVLGYGKER